MGPCTANARWPTVDSRCHGTTIICCGRPETLPDNNIGDRCTTVDKVLRSLVMRHLPHNLDLLVVSLLLLRDSGTLFHWTVELLHPLKHLRSVLRHFSLIRHNRTVARASVLWHDINWLIDLCMMTPSLYVKCNISILFNWPLTVCRWLLPPSRLVYVYCWVATGVQVETTSLHPPMTSTVQYQQAHTTPIEKQQKFWCFWSTLWNTMSLTVRDPSPTLNQFGALVKTVLLYKAHETLP